MSEAIYDMHAYTTLTDSIYWQILSSSDPNLAEVSFLKFCVCVCVCVWVCVCVAMKRSATRMASTTSDASDTSSKQ